MSTYINSRTHMTTGEKILKRRDALFWHVFGISRKRVPTEISDLIFEYVASEVDVVTSLAEDMILAITDRNIFKTKISSLVLRRDLNLMVMMDEPDDDEYPASEADEEFHMHRMFEKRDAISKFNYYRGRNEAWKWRALVKPIGTRVEVIDYEAIGRSIKEIFKKSIEVLSPDYASVDDHRKEPTDVVETYLIKDLTTRFHRYAQYINQDRLLIWFAFQEFIQEFEEALGA